MKKKSEDIYNPIFSRFLSLILFLFSIYVPLFLYNYFLVQYWEKFKNTDFVYKSFHSKIKALKENYIPTFYPEQIIAKSQEFSKKINVFPIGSLPNRKTYLCDEGYGLIKYKTDRFGLRNDDKIWDNLFLKENIYLIGDSFIHGSCVENKHTISSQLQSLSGKKVFNLGTGSNGPYEYMAIINSILEPILEKEIKRSWAVLAIYVNDNQTENDFYNDLLKETSSILDVNSNGVILPKKKYIDNLERVISSYFPISSNEILNILTNQKEDNWTSNLEAALKLKNRSQNQNFIKDNFLYKNLVRLDVYKYLTLTAIRDYIKVSTKFFKELYYPNIKEKPTELAIKNLVRVCQRKCKPIVISLQRNTIREQLDSRAISFRKKIRKYSNKYGANFIDGAEVIDKNKISDFSPNGAHYSIDGYRKLARLIFERIK